MFRSIKDWQLIIVPKWIQWTIVPKPQIRDKVVLVLHTDSYLKHKGVLVLHIEFSSAVWPFLLTDEWFSVLNLFADTKNIMVNGWTLTMLKQHVLCTIYNLDCASMCKGDVQTTGFFLGYVHFIAFEWIFSGSRENNGKTLWIIIEIVITFFFSQNIENLSKTKE